MAYQALYRQWRPHDFSHMVGQEAIVETLRNQVQTGRVAHAYLFCGSRGTGKTSAAKILARAINCENPRNGDPCGVCEMCRQMEAEDFLDIIEMDAASNNGVEEARDLRESVKYPPQSARYKVYIIDEVHMLTSSASNALLKTMEEPPPYLVFILATTEPQKLLPTILSRCQRFDFGRIPAPKIMQRLREAADGAGAETTDGALMAIARSAEGGMRDALSILDMCIGYGRKIDEELVRQVLGTSDRAFLFRFGRALKDQDAAETIRLVDELMNAGKDPLVYSRDFSSHVRNMIMAKCCGGGIAEILDLTEEDAQDYLRESSDISMSRLMEILDQFMQLETNLRFAASPRLALENTALRCCLRTEETDSLALNDRIAELENQIQALSDKLAEVQISGRVPAERNTPEPAKPVRRPAAKPPKPESAAGAAVSGKAEDIWKSAVNTLKKTEPGIFSQLNSLGRFVGAEGSAFRWKADPGYEAVVLPMLNGKNKPVIEEALSAAGGMPCTFEALDTEAEQKKSEENSEEMYEQELRDVFGTEAVTVLDNLPTA